MFSIAVGSAMCESKKLVDIILNFENGENWLLNGGIEKIFKDQPFCRKDFKFLTYFDRENIVKEILKYIPKLEFNNFIEFFKNLKPTSKCVSWLYSSDIIFSIMDKCDEMGLYNFKNLINAINTNDIGPKWLFDENNRFNNLLENYVNKEEKLSFSDFQALINVINSSDIGKKWFSKQSKQDNDIIKMINCIKPEKINNVITMLFVIKINNEQLLKDIYLKMIEQKK